MTNATEPAFRPLQAGTIVAVDLNDAFGPETDVELSALPAADQFRNWMRANRVLL